MRTIVTSNQYKKDLKLARKRGCNETLLDDIIKRLASDIPLPKENRDHSLTGNFVGFRECHIQPDWLLIYSKETIKSKDGKIKKELKILQLVRTGTHSDLFE
ncbi:MAG: type II toxin-antitoxin system YafQ family toxin [Porphyromonadaceae bacterium]|nr:type II toxin-antitoxin system YafQ family toxin [Porphyromonadaceae bacterium]